MVSATSVSVRPVKIPKALGGYPTPNSSTLIPNAFADQKWPNSCTTTSNSSIGMNDASAIRTVSIYEIRLVGRQPGNLRRPGACPLVGCRDRVKVRVGLNIVLGQNLFHQPVDAREPDLAL